MPARTLPSRTVAVAGGTALVLTALAVALFAHSSSNAATAPAPQAIPVMVAVLETPAMTATRDSSRITVALDYDVPATLGCARRCESPASTSHKAPAS